MRVARGDRPGVFSRFGEPASGSKSSRRRVKKTRWSSGFSRAFFRAGRQKAELQRLAAHDVQGLKVLAELCGDHFVCGIVFYLGDVVVPFGKNLWAVPVRMACN
jgi:hypothetical protein